VKKRKPVGWLFPVYLGPDPKDLEVTAGFWRAYNLYGRVRQEPLLNLHQPVPRI
jgi:hypothetical protein